MMTYGDGVCGVDINKLLDFHESHGKAVTVTGVKEPARFGDIYHDGGKVVKFSEKTGKRNDLINGGFYVMNKKFFEFIDKDTNYKLEFEPLQTITAAEELMVYQHDGMWKCADMLREVDVLTDMYNRGEAFWIK
jgi:glucose-1-phosphate cytidylyltransferase